MNRRVDVLDRERLLDDFFQVDRYRLRHETFSGEMSPELDRLVFKRHDAVAALLWHTGRQRLILVEQFRPPVYAAGEEGWLVELPAGLLDEPGEPPEKTMIREIEEETGYRVSDVQELTTYWSSAGASTERVTLFYAEVDDGNRIDTGGGVDAGEDLRVVEASLEELSQNLDSGSIWDAKTLIGVQWLLNQRAG